MEVNASPGLEGVETTTGLDIASMMIRITSRYAADQAPPEIRWLTGRSAPFPPRAIS